MLILLHFETGDAFAVNTDEIKMVSPARFNGQRENLLALRSGGETKIIENAEQVIALQDKARENRDDR